MEPASYVIAATCWLITAILSKQSVLKAWAKKVGLEKALKSMTTELISIKQDLDEAHVRPHQIQPSHVLPLLNSLQQIAYSAEDLVDELDYYRIRDEIELGGGSVEDEVSGSSGFKLASRRIISSFKRTSCSGAANANVLSPLKRTSRVPVTSLVRRMKQLTEQLGKLHSELNHLVNDYVVRLPFSSMDDSARDAVATDFGRFRSTTSLASERVVFGRERERNFLIRLLTSSENHALSTVTVTGMGGVGKTTLAQLVYNDEGVVRHFESRIWVCVSPNFDVHKITCEMVEALTLAPHPQVSDLEALQRILANHLRSKRFLLVLDDMWSLELSKWEMLFSVLASTGEHGSMILVTTRDQSVAKMTHSSEYVFLDSLDDESLWELFKSYSFGDHVHMGNRELELIGRQIIRKLKGSPLAARTVGAMLTRSLDVGYWRRVLDSLESNSAGFSHGGILEALKLSYDYLPFPLKRSFSYCALFPKDYLFNKEELVHLWMALDFVGQQDNTKNRIEDVGSQYFDHLVASSFLQEVHQENPVPGDMHSSYVMHDLMHDLALRVSSGEILGTDGQLHEPVPSTVRHISFTTEFGHESIHEQVTILRSLIFLCNGTKSPESIHKILKEAKGLRVLILNAAAYSRSAFASIGSLTHLRYLRLNSAEPLELPEEICRLYHLQVLDLSHCPEIQELPKEFRNLVNLRHFISEKRVHSMIAGVGKLTSLQELREFCVGRESDFRIGQLKNLKKLRGSLSIKNLKNVTTKQEATDAGLVEKLSLDRLSLSWGWEDTRLGYCSEQDVLEGFTPPSNLRSLDITGSVSVQPPSWLIDRYLDNIERISIENFINWKALPPLGQLPLLKDLCLASVQKLEEIGLELYGSKSDVCFPSLKKMVVKDMPALESWGWDKDRLLFPTLEILELNNCPALRELPLSNYASVNAEGSNRFPCLWSLRIVSCPQIEQLPPLPHTHRLSDILISGVVDTNDKLQLSLFQGTLRLEIRSNPNLRYLDEALIFYNLRNLSSLHVENCPKLCSLFSSDEGNEKNWLSCQSLNNLHSLQIVNCVNLESLSGLDQLPCLEERVIRGCPRIGPLSEMGFPATSNEMKYSNNIAFSPKQVEVLQERECDDYIVELW